MKRGFSRCGCAVTITFLLTLASAAPSPGYHLLETFNLGEGGWDYLTFDGDHHRLFISRATRVLVVDSNSGKFLGQIPDTPGVHGIALAPELNRGFVSNGKEGTVSIFDFTTLKVLSKVKVGDNPDAILYEPTTKRVFTFNGHSHDSTVFDGEKASVVKTIPLGGKPEFAVNDGKGEIFVNIEDTSEIAVLDASTLVVKARWPLAPCHEPSGLAIDRKSRRLFSGCENRMMAIVNADNGKVLATPAIGDGVDGDAFDPDTGLAFASCGEGILTVVHEETPDKFSILENVSTQKGARTMTIDPKTHRIFLVTAKFGPPPPATLEQPHPRPAILPDSFVVLVLGR